MKNVLCIFILAILMMSCSQEEKADLIIYNANVYTVNKNQPKADFVAVKDDKIWMVGDGAYDDYASDNTTLIDAGGKFVMPGWIEGHGHFSGLGKSLQNLNFINSKNWKEIISMVQDKASSLPKGEWIEGRGWHQEKWSENPNGRADGYPIHDDLSTASPDNPVILYHASGHSLYANQAAMNLAGVTMETSDPPGGRIVKDMRGNPIGVFEERAMNLIYEPFMEYKKGLDQEALDNLWYEAVDLAADECLKHGITSFQDAGSKFFELDNYERLAKEDKLGIRLWAMVRHSAEDMKGKLSDCKAYRINNLYTCNAIKSEVDGALGAYGAWLLKPYTDKPGFVGQNTTAISEVKDIAELALNNDMQLCVHAIGDRANRVVVDIYEGMLKQKEDGKKKRWRIEHAQHVDPSDIPRFAQNGIIASMQGIHCTSDAPFVVKRLGETRAKNGAYAWRSFIDHGVLVANGTDAPVEDVDPLPSFYASVTRKRADSGLTFFTEQSMSREEAIYSYTLGNAYAAFEEDIKGSIEPGKLADMVIMSNDLINCKDEEILDSEVEYTILGGKVVYQK